MGFLDRVVAGAEFRSASGLANPAAWLTDAFGGGASYTGERVTVNKGLGLSSVFAAVSHIAEAVASLPLKVYRDLDEDNRSEARDHRAWRMLHDMPNPYTPADRFWSAITTHLLLWGNAFLLKDRGEFGLVDQLRILHPADIIVGWKDGRKSFEHNTTNGKDIFSDEEVLHLWGLSTDGLVGLSPISTCRQAFGTAIARERFEGGFYERGATLRGLLQHPGRLSPEAQKNLRDSFKSIYSGAANAHQTAVLEEGMEFTPLSMNLQDMEFVASTQMSRQDVATIFKLPASYLNAATGDSLTYSTVESNKIQFASQAVAPWTNTIAKALAADPGVFPQKVFYPEFVLAGLMRGDSKARAEFYEKMNGMKALTVNEIRGFENLPPLPGGDSFPKPPPALTQAEDKPEENGSKQPPLPLPELVDTAKK